ncbi:uncharacterized protein LOC111099888 isoform X2 [Crassostrea virginica]
MPKIKKSKRIAERRAGLQESHQEAHVNEQHPKEHPVSSNRDGVLDKSPGQTPEVAVLNSKAVSTLHTTSTRGRQVTREFTRGISSNDVRDEVVKQEMLELFEVCPNYHQSPRHHEY